MSRLTNIFRDPFVTFTRPDSVEPDVVWGVRTDKVSKRIGRPVKVFDPNFVHERVDTSSDPVHRGLGYVAIGAALLMAACVGAML